MDLLEAENQEYQQTINQTNDKFEEALGELAVAREHLKNTKVCNSIHPSSNKIQ